MGPGSMLERLCTSCAASHRAIVYKRITDAPGKDFRDLFTRNWFSTNNRLNTDFKLYSSIADALADVRSWTFCNYDDGGVGFPRDCGPNGAVGGQWYPAKASTWKIVATPGA